MRSLLAAAAAVALLLPACAGEPGATSDEAIGQTKQPIVGGTVSTTLQDATVLLRENGQFSCTGTLIAANLVLTARHCVSQLDENSADPCGTITSDDPATGFGLSVGVNAMSAASVATGVKVYKLSTNSLCGGDMALIQFDKDIVGAKIAPIRFTALTVGELTTAVGYGEDGNGQTPSQRLSRSGIAIGVVGPATDNWQTAQGQNLPLSLAAGEVATGDATCFGDSGGPLFDAAGNIVGVTSRGLDDACIDRPTIFTAITTHEQLIRDALAGAGHPLAATGATTTTPSTSTATTTSAAAATDPTTSDTSTAAPLSVNACSAAAPGAAASPVAGMLLAVGLAMAARRRRAA